MKNEGDKYPLAVGSLLLGRYVDDNFAGVASKEILIEKAKEVTLLCTAGGFPLVKWNSNSSEFFKKFLKAMATVQYINSTLLASGSTLSFLISKTKVAPLKRLPIPALELGAAVLLTKLANHVLDNSKLPISHIHLWTDAKAALIWIRSLPRRWEEFVGNRVALIQERIANAQWGHVPGMDNSTDGVSRGLFTSQLKEYQL